MKILVCIKQVFNPEFIEKIDSCGRGLVLRPQTEYRMNRFDEYALEEALKIKETISGVSVDVVTAGGERAVEVIKRALGMGADSGSIIRDNAISEKDVFAVAEMLAAEAKKKPYDIILTGIMSEDLMQGQTGPIIAELIDIPSVTGVVALKPDPENGIAEIEKEREGGVRDLLRISLPALFTVQAGINTPRYPTLSNILKADTREIISVEPSEGMPRQEFLRFYLPGKTRNGVFLEGTTKEKANRLYEILKSRNALKG